MKHSATTKYTSVIESEKQNKQTKASPSRHRSRSNQKRRFVEIERTKQLPVLTKIEFHLFCSDLSSFSGPEVFRIAKSNRAQDPRSPRVSNSLVPSPFFRQKKMFQPKNNRRELKRQQHLMLFFNADVKSSKRRITELNT